MILHSWVPTGFIRWDTNARDMQVFNKTTLAVIHNINTKENTEKLILQASLIIILIGQGSYN